VHRANNFTIFMCRLYRDSENLNLLEPKELLQACTGISFLICWSVTSFFFLCSHFPPSCLHARTHTHTQCACALCVAGMCYSFSCLIASLLDRFCVFSGSNMDDAERQRKSRTLPHPRHHSVPAVPLPRRHFRSLSECKQTQVQALPNATLVQAGDWALGASR
jgi:hypothetical protein